MQSLPPAEIIVVNNGPERLDPMREGAVVGLAGSIPLRVLTLPPFSGPSISRNLGAWEAESSHVAFLDDDDEYAPSYLEAMQRRISEVDPGVLYGAKLWLDVDGSISREKRLHSVPGERWFETLYRHENPGFGGNLVVLREEFFRIGGFPVDLPSGEDRAFAMAALKAGSLVAYVDGAEVHCHDPVGYRAKMRSDKWFTNLKLIRMYWGDVNWRNRLYSVWRWSRSLRRRSG